MKSGYFFDVEDQDWDKWNARWATISRLRKLRGGRKGIPVRLLMTSGCLEYWFLLHYENVCQQVHEKQEKAAILERLRKHVPIYTKGQKKHKRKLRRTTKRQSCGESKPLKH